MGGKSKKIISDTLLELMKDHPFQEITISEICAWSKLSRSTFYNHFSSKEEVIFWTSTCSISQYLEDYISVSEDWLEKLVYFFFQESMTQRDYLTTLMEHRLYHLHRVALLEICFVHKSIVTQKQYLETPPSLRRFLVRTYVDTALSFYEEWKYTDFALSIEELTTMYLDIFHKNLPRNDTEIN